MENKDQILGVGCSYQKFFSKTFVRLWCNNHINYKMCNLKARLTCSKFSFKKLVLFIGCHSWRSPSWIADNHGRPLHWRRGWWNVPRGPYQGRALRLCRVHQV